MDILCVDDRILLTEEDVVGSVVGSAGAGAGAGGSAGSSGSVYHVVELVAHASVGPDTRDSSVLGHVQRMAADLALTSGALRLKVDSTRVAGWIVNYELADREEDDSRRGSV